MSPIPILPRPDEVLHALRVLWFEQGLGRELWTSFGVNLEALLLTLVISLAASYLTVVPVFRPVATAVSKGRFLGLIGLTFIFTLLLGGGQPLKVALLVFGMTRLLRHLDGRRGGGDPQGARSITRAPCA